jgi:hypothetical protein
MREKLNMRTIGFGQYAHGCFHMPRCYYCEEDTVVLREI